MNIFKNKQKFKKAANYILKSKVSFDFGNTNIHYKNKFVKNSAGLNIEKTFPTEEEHFTTLLNEMRNSETLINTNISDVINFTQKGSILFISETNILKNISLGQFIEIKKSILAQCVSIRTNITTFLIVNSSSQ